MLVFTKLKGVPPKQVVRLKLRILVVGSPLTISCECGSNAFLAHFAQFLRSWRCLSSVRPSYPDLSRKSTVLSAGKLRQVHPVSTTVLLLSQCFRLTLTTLLVSHNLLSSWNLFGMPKHMTMWYFIQSPQ